MLKIFKMSSSRKGLRAGVVVLLLAILMIAVSAAVAAGPDQTGSTRISEEKIEVLRQLWGQDVSMGQVLEQVFPQALEGKSKDQVERLYEIKMVWPDPEGDYPQSVKLRGTFKRDVVPLETLPYYYIDCKSYIDARQEPRIDFGSSNRTLLPHPWYRFPYMAVWSYLWYETGQLVWCAFADGENVYEVCAEDWYYATREGYYRVTGLHYVELPPGNNPPSQTTSTATRWVHVGS